jgi:hypothetical protein
VPGRVGPEAPGEGDEVGEDKDGEENSECDHGSKYAAV